MYKLFFVLCLVWGKTVNTPKEQISNLDYSVNTFIRSNTDSNIEPDTLYFGTTEIIYPVADYVVKKTKRLRKRLYIIDLERSDSIYRIFSHFDGKKDAGDSKLHKHDTVRVKLIEPSEVDRMALWDRANRLDWNLNNKYYGVNIVKHLFRDPYYFEVRYCDDLNGRYLKSKKE